MALALTPETEQRIGALVESGRYASVQEVLEQALERLEEDVLFAAWKPAELQVAVQEGLDSAQRGEFVNAEELEQRLDALFQKT